MLGHAEPIQLKGQKMSEQATKQYEPGTIGSILEDRLADLLTHHTIDAEQFVPLVLADIEQDIPLVGAGRDLLAALRRLVRAWEKGERLHNGSPQSFSDPIGQARAALAKAEPEA